MATPQAESMQHKLRFELQVIAGPSCERQGTNLMPRRTPNCSVQVLGSDFGEPKHLNPHPYYSIRKV